MPTISPAEVVIESFGGIRATARVLHLDPSAVSHWRFSGRVPGFHLRRILVLAKQHGIEITAEDLILGRETTHD
jgi:hypothetical protein